MSDKRLTFLSPKHLAAWLRGHPEGKAIASEVAAPLLEAACRRCNKPWEPVLVVVDGSGWIEVYGGTHVRVHIAERPYICEPGEPLWAEAQQTADSFLDYRLPPRFAQLFVPRHLRAEIQVRQLTPEMIAERDLQLALLRALRESGY